MTAEEQVKLVTVCVSVFMLLNEQQAIEASNKQNIKVVLPQPPKDLTLVYMISTMALTLTLIFYLLLQW
jgi:hypothetical protein